MWVYLVALIMTESLLCLFVFKIKKNIGRIRTISSRRMSFIKVFCHDDAIKYLCSRLMKKIYIYYNSFHLCLRKRLRRNCKMLKQRKASSIIVIPQNKVCFFLIYIELHTNFIEKLQIEAFVKGKKTIE